MDDMVGGELAGCCYASTPFTLPPPIFYLLMTGALFSPAIFSLLQHHTPTRRCLPHLRRARRYPLSAIFDSDVLPKHRGPSWAPSSQAGVHNVGRDGG